MDTKLKNFLAKNKIKYKLTEHKKVYTAFNEAETQHRQAKEVAKTVLLKTDAGYALVAVPAQKYVDFKKVQKALGAKKVSMARESEIAKVLKTKIGLIVPFGNLYNLPVLADRALLKNKTIITSAGSYTESVELRTADFLKATQALKGSFTK